MEHTQGIQTSRFGLAWKRRKFPHCENWWSLRGRARAREYLPRAYRNHCRIREGQLTFSQQGAHHENLANLRIETIRLFCACCGVSVVLRQTIPDSRQSWRDSPGKYSARCCGPPGKSPIAKILAELSKGLEHKFPAEGLATRQGSLVGNRAWIARYAALNVRAAYRLIHYLLTTGRLQQCAKRNSA